MTVPRILQHPFLPGLLIAAVAVVPMTAVRADEATPPGRCDRAMAGMMLAFEPPMAQRPDAPLGGGPGPGGMDRPEMERQRRHLEQLRLLKLLEVLDLKDSQEEPFLTAFRAMRKSQRDLDERKGQLLGRLSDLIQAPARDDKKIGAAVDSVLALDEKKREVVRSFVDKARSILDVEQIGRLLLFQEKFEFELLERVREFRRAGRLGGGIPDQSESN